MKRLLSLPVLLALATSTHADPRPPLQFLADHGSVVSPGQPTINFSGAGVSLVQDSANKRINVVVSGVGAGVSSLTCSAPLHCSASTGAITASLDPTNVTAGSYTNASITVDTYGRLTAASSGTAGGVTSVSASGALCSSGGSTPAITLCGTVPIANGGTGSTTQSFVDLSSVQSIGGAKTFTGTVTAASFVGDVAGSCSSAINFSGNLAGDVTGAQGATVVGKINGSPLGTLSGASSGQAIVWNGSSWAPAAVGSVTSITGGTGLSGGTITSTGTLALASTAVTAGSYTYGAFTVDAQGRLTAASSGAAPVTSITGGGGISVSGTSAITLGSSFGGDIAGSVAAATVGALQGHSVSNASPSSANLLLYSSGQWTPTALSGAGSISSSGVLALSTIGVTKGGTGLTAITTGDLLFGSGTNALSSLGLSSTAGSFLRAGASAPEWSALVLPNAATRGDIAVSTATNAFGTLSDVALGSVLASGGVGSVPSYVAAGGDVAGAYGSLTVGALQGRPVSNAAPASANLLLYASSQWTPTALSGDATISSSGALTLGSTITAGGPTGSATSVPIITYDAKGRLTAVSSASIAIDVAAITSGTLSVGRGGTGLSSFATGDIPCASAGSTLSALAVSSTAGTFLRSTGSIPSWSALVLPNAATTGDVLYATGTNAIGRLADVATGSVLASGGLTTAPSYVAPGGDITGAIGAITVGKIQGYAVASSAPSSGQVLAYSGSQWTPTASPVGALAIYGDGSDGTCTFDGTTTNVGVNDAAHSNTYCATRSGTTYTLQRACYCTDAPVSTGIYVNTAAWPLFATSSIALSGTGGMGGNAGATSGTSNGDNSVVSGGILGLGTRGVGGSTGAGAASTAASNCLGGTGGNGGAGTNAAGTAGACTVIATTKGPTHAILACLTGTAQAGATLTLIQGGTGGASGGGDGTNSGGGGGSGSRAVVVAAPTITIGASAALSAVGGNGGNSAAGNTGGGGGGGGGVLYYVAHTVNNSGSITAAGGSGGAGRGTGASGSSGNSGAVIFCQM